MAKENTYSFYSFFADEMFAKIDFMPRHLIQFESET